MTDRDELRIRMAFAVIEGSAGTRAAEHAYEFKTAKWTDALRSADAALTALDDAGWRMSKWMLISEAPKKGRLLLHSPHRLSDLGAQTEVVGWWSEPDQKWIYHIEQDGLVDVAIMYVMPTHFMPLPSPPKEPST